jgi:hypothetical protein
MRQPAHLHETKIAERDLQDIGPRVVMNEFNRGPRRSKTVTH